MTTIAEQKAELRARALLARKAFDPAAGNTLAAVVLRELTFAAGAVVAGVWPMQDEMDLRPLLHALHHRGHRIVLPETPPKGTPLIFRQWTPGCAMIRERFGTYRPDGPVSVPDLILVPLLAFDPHGYRLGYGGGYYDRTLNALPDAASVGFGYAAQMVNHVPHEPHDVPLARIATEVGIFQARE